MTHQEAQDKIYTELGLEAVDAILSARLLLSSISALIADMDKQQRLNANGEVRLNKPVTARLIQQNRKHGAEEALYRLRLVSKDLVKTANSLDVKLELLRAPKLPKVR